MKKIIYNNYGGSEVMSLVDVEQPNPTKDELLIEVKAASINPVDWKLRLGEMKMMTGKEMPRAMGCDFAGIVKKIGSDVTNIKVGDEVFGWIPYKEANSFAEFVISKESLTVKKPKNIDFKEAACLPMIGATGIIGLKEKGNISNNFDVLINGCTGGVGHMATQLAKSYGANITGTCTGKNIETAKNLGVDMVVDYKNEDVHQLNKKFDIIFDTAGSMSYKEVKAILKPNGKFLNLMPSGLLDILHGLISKKYKVIMASVNKGHLEELAKLAESGSIKPLISKTVSLDEAISTITSLENGEKVVSKAVIVNE